MIDGDSRGQTEVAVFSLIDQGLGALRIPYVKGQVEQLTELVFLLDHWASRINLTGHQDPYEMASRLVLDAAALSAALPELADARSLADLGSGAGFPGLPLSILNPGLDVHLVESRLKRHHFQKESRRRLGLPNVHPILGRSDEVTAVTSDIVLAQAMTQPRQALELMAQWAHADSILVLPASASASRPESPLGIGVPELREYRVPGAEIPRKLWISRITPS
jgi:16S rRNA (guanine527-N7)-methyltransferase